MPSSARRHSAPLAWRVWLGVSAWTAISGWVLSLASSLGANGYLVAAVLGITVGAIAWQREWVKPWRRIRKPWRRGPPLLFALLALAAFAGGALYPPSNYDTFWYRLPRVLHWLDAGHWHWIETPEGRYNYLANGMEWFHAPLVAWTNSYRLLFLPNIAAFLLLPGLCFSLFRRMHVPARTAWWWMWLAPAAWFYASQAGSVANDLISAVYALAALELALRARHGGRFSDLAWSVMAAALLTNTKQTNLPLLLPWAVAAWPSLPKLGRHALATFGLALAAIAVSVVPITMANWMNTGHWSGWSKAEQNFVPAHPLFAVGANLVILVLQNILPPWVPGAAAMNQAMAEFASRHPDLVKGFEFFGAVPTSFDEAWAGSGLFLTLLLVPFFFARRAPKAATQGPAPRDRARPMTRLLSLSILIASLVLLSQMGCRQPARYFAAYFPLLLALVIRRPGSLAIVNARMWQIAAMGGLLATIGYVALLKTRPLLPLRPVLAAWALHHPESPLAVRLKDRLGTGERGQHPLEAFIPFLSDVQTVGFAAVAAGEPYLWVLSAGRRVVHLPRDASEELLDRRGIEYFVVNDLAALYAGKADGLAWSAALGGEIVAAFPMSQEDVLQRRKRGGLPSIEDLAYQRSRDGQPAINNFYLARRAVRSLADPDITR